LIGPPFAQSQIVMAGLDPAIHLNESRLLEKWIAGSSPAMTATMLAVYVIKTVAYPFM